MSINTAYNTIERWHVEAALGYIRKTGEPGKHGILHVDTHAGARSRALKCGKNLFSVKEVVRVAFLYYYGYGEKEISKIPNIIQKIKAIKEKDGLKMPLTTGIAKSLLMKLGAVEAFKHEDFIRIDDDGNKTTLTDKAADEAKEDDDEN